MSFTLCSKTREASGRNIAISWKAGEKPASFSTNGSFLHRCQGDNPVLRPQASTERQYIINYTLGQTTSDTMLLKDYLGEHIQSYGRSPEKLTADAGYGSEENYTFLEEQGVEAFVKYNYFDLEQKQKKPNPFHSDNLHYDAKEDTVTCPIGQSMIYIGEKRKRSKSGYEKRGRRKSRFQTASSKIIPICELSIKYRAQYGSDYVRRNSRTRPVA